MYVGLRILWSKIQLLCYSFMLIIICIYYANVLKLGNHAEKKTCSLQLTHQGAIANCQIFVIVSCTVAVTSRHLRPRWCVNVPRWIAFGAGDFNGINIIL